MSIEKEKIRAVIFDMDGVLVNTESLYFEACNKIFKQYNVVLTEQQWGSVVGKHGKDTKSVLEKILNKKIDVYKWADAVHNEVEKHTEKVQLIPGVAELLRIISFGKYLLGVASSTRIKLVRRYLEAVDLEDNFSFIIGGDQISAKKPDPEIYLLSSEIAGVIPNECIVFEDSSTGLESAKRAGMMCVVVPNEFTRNHDFSRADLVAERLDAPEVLALF